MRNIIEGDFGVGFLDQQDSASLFAAVKDVFWYFVVLDESEGTSRIDQVYLHRYDLAKAYHDIKTGGKKALLNERKNVIAALSKETEDLKIELNDYYFTIASENIIQQLESDVKVLTEIESKSPIEFAQETWMKKNSDMSALEQFSNEMLKIINFEKVLIGKEEEAVGRFGLSAVLDTIQRQTVLQREALFELLTMNFEYVYLKDDCSCDRPDYCFFEVLKPQQRKYFTGDYLDEEDAIDFEKVKVDFNAYWKSLSFSEQVLLGYIGLKFENTTLLNMYFLDSNFDMQEYIRRMCEPYQPDSEDEEYVRVVAATAINLLR